MKAYIYSRVQCGECGGTMVLNEKDKTIRCPIFQCKEFDVEYEAPQITLKKYKPCPPKKS